MVRSEPLAEVVRGQVVESVHLGDIAVVDRSGNLLYHTGDPHRVTYMRSSAKPLQAIPYVEMSGRLRFGLTDTEVAVTCASHSGEDQHVEAVLSILKKIGLEESYLKCGTHMPIHGPTARRMWSLGRKSTPVHSNCSGKHAGMLALSVLLGADHSEYLDPCGPVQSLILKTASEMMGAAPESIKIGIDGCGAPVFGVPLSWMARGWANLSDPSGLCPSRRSAVEDISRSMRGNPYMVAGTGRLSTDLMKAAGARVLAKSGAEGVYCAALVGRGIGLALKITDGSSRAMGPIVLSVLEQLGVLVESDLQVLSGHGRLEVRNFRGDLCGEIRPAVTLTRT